MERNGLHGTEQDGVFFSEAAPPTGYDALREISVEKNRQNLSLQTIKALMAREAIAAGADAIVNFRYGQRSQKWWQQAFTLRWDTEVWYGSGTAIRLGSD